MLTAKRLVLTLAVLAVAAFCALGCESQSDETAATGKPVREKPVIGLLTYREDDIYVGIVTEAIRKALEGKADLEIFHGKDDQLVQNEQIEALLKEKKVDALALNIVNTMAAENLVDSIQQTGIPVVFFNREPDLDRIKKYAGACFIGTTISEAGTMQGDIIKELWDKHPEYDRNKDGKCQYIMVQANLDNPEALARTEHSVKQARARGVVMQQVGETLICNWSESLAYDTMKLVFPLYGEELELVIANNDSMALGAIRALNEFGYNLEGGAPETFIPVIGVDAIPAAVKAIRNGTMSATVEQDGLAMGRAVAALALNAATGKGFLEGTVYTWDASGIAVRIPYARFTHD